MLRNTVRRFRFRHLLFLMIEIGLPAYLYFVPSLEQTRNSLDHTWHLIVFAADALVAAILFGVELILLGNERYESLTGKLESIQNGQSRCVEYIGLAQDILINHSDRLKAIAKKAVSVQNTLIFFNSNVATKNVDSDIYSNTPASINRREIIEAVLTKPRPWTEIYSEKDLIVFNKEIRQLHVEHSIYYFPMVTAKPYPVVNMAIFDFDDGRTEVWFGFGFFDGYNGPVFRTCDPDLCGYFQEYFKAIYNDSRPWKSIGRMYLEGAWISVCYGDDKIKGPNQGQDSSKKRLANCAVIFIFSEGRDIKVSGWVFDFKNDIFEYDRSFESTSASLYMEGNPPWLAFTFRDIHKRSADKSDKRGGGHYFFSSKERFYEFDGEVVSFDGPGRSIIGRKLQKDYNLLVRQGAIGDRRQLLSDIVNDKAISVEEPQYGDSPFLGSSYFYSPDGRRPMS
ncbi:hypothetical protein [Massilia sp. Root335]|uniref:hypothetical protein n=1 Tax=Massilia sp. Root335 TaxID=1736517 RepID=UPI000B31EBA1|nr:hypothetical protein [Massilia sp. Root335]